MENAIEVIARERLAEGGYRLTRQRQMILSILFQNEGQHFTAEEIHQRITQEQGSAIGIATVYRNLVILHDAGIVEKLEIDNENSRYEIIHGVAGIRHHHLVCMKCGAIIEMQENLIDEALKEQISEKYCFNVQDNRINLYGLCSCCQMNYAESLV